MLAPEIFKQPNHGTMEDANGKLQNPQNIDASQCPAILQHQVIEGLNTEAGQFTKHVETIGKVLKLDQFELPRTPLLRNDGLEGNGSVAVPPSSVMEEDMNFFHGGDSAID